LHGHSIPQDFNKSSLLKEASGRPTGDGKSNVETVRVVIDVHEAERLSRTILIRAANSNTSSRYRVTYRPAISPFDYAKAGDVDSVAIGAHQRNFIFRIPRLDLDTGSDIYPAILERPPLKCKLFNGIRLESCTDRLTITGEYGE
jgi:hypothetical protein